MSMRDDMAEILELVAGNGLQGPRELDEALDALSEAIFGPKMVKKLAERGFFGLREAQKFVNLQRDLLDE